MYTILNQLLDIKEGMGLKVRRVYVCICVCEFMVRSHFVSVVKRWVIEPNDSWRFMSVPHIANRRKCQVNYLNIKKMKLLLKKDN